MKEYRYHSQILHTYTSWHYEVTVKFVIEHSKHPDNMIIPWENAGMSSTCYSKQFNMYISYRIIYTHPTPDSGSFGSINITQVISKISERKKKTKNIDTMKYGNDSCVYY